MAYDRYDTRDDHPRWRDREDGPRSPGRDDNRGFFERAGDEIASWFGDDRDRHPDDQRLSRNERSGWGHDREHGSGRDYDRGYGRDAQRDRSDREESYRGTAWPSSERDYNPSWRSELRDRPDDRQRGGYRPITGDYARSEQMSSGFGGGWRSDREDRQRDTHSEWAAIPTAAAAEPARRPVGPLARYRPALSFVAGPAHERSRPRL